MKGQLSSSLEMIAEVIVKAQKYEQHSTFLHKILQLLCVLPPRVKLATFSQTTSVIGP